MCIWRLSNELDTRQGYCWITVRATPHCTTAIFLPNMTPKIMNNQRNFMVGRAGVVNCKISSQKIVQNDEKCDEHRIESRQRMFLYPQSSTNWFNQSREWATTRSQVRLGFRMLSVLLSVP